MLKHTTRGFVPTTGVPVRARRSAISRCSIGAIAGVKWFAVKRTRTKTCKSGRPPLRLLGSYFMWQSVQGMEGWQPDTFALKIESPLGGMLSSGAHLYFSCCIVRSWRWCRFRRGSGLVSACTVCHVMQLPVKLSDGWPQNAAQVLGRCTDYTSTRTPALAASQGHEAIGIGTAR